MKRALAALGFLLSGCLSAVAGSMTLLGAGSAGAAAPPPADCSAFLPAAFNTSALYISWTTADGLGGFGMACLNGNTPVAASTLGTFSASSPTASGMTGIFTFTNVTWLTQGTGTIYAAAQTTTNVATQHFFNVSDGTLGNLAALRTQSNAAFRGDAYGGSVISNFTPTANVPFKSAISYASGAQTVVVNGGTAATGANAVGSAPYTASRIGASPTGTLTKAGVTTANAFFTTALDAATLQAITQ